MQNEYLTAENRILRSELPKRLRLSIRSVQTLAELASDSAAKLSSKSGASPNRTRLWLGTAGSLRRSSTVRSSGESRGDLRSTAKYSVLLPQVVDCVLLALVHPASNANEHKPERIETRHREDYHDRIAWDPAMCVVFSAFHSLDITGSEVTGDRHRGPLRDRNPV